MTGDRTSDPGEKFSADAEEDWIALLNFLGDVTAELLEVENLQEISKILDQTVDQIISVQYPILYLYNEELERLEQIWSKGFTEEELRIAEESALERHPGWVYRNGEGFYVPDVQNDPDDRTQDTPRQIEVRSRLYHPVSTRGETVGAFGFGASEPNAFDSEHIAALGFYSHLIGAAYGRLHRERDLREARTHLEQTNETLRAIREVSKLMVRERDPDRILQSTCDLLVESDAYDLAFIAVRNASGEPEFQAHAPSSLPRDDLRDFVENEPVVAKVSDLLEGETSFAEFDSDGPVVADEGEPVTRAVGASLEYAGIVHGALVLGASGPSAGSQEKTLLQGVASDVAFVLHMLERESDDSRLADQALRDWLTDLPNRALFRNRLDQAIARAERHDRSFALLLVDLDNLKEVNDSLGHAAGDRLLVRVAERLQNVVREYDTVARIGGDEFTILLEDVHSKEVLESVLERIEEQLDGPFQIYGETFQTSASIGAVCYRRLVDKFETPDIDKNELLRAADRAMYKAKELPGTQWSRPEPADLRSGEHIQKSNRLRRAIDEGQMVPHYQPIVTLGDESLVGLEALARWERPDGSTRSAGEFIQTAERMGRLWDVTRKVYRQAFHHFQEWRREPDCEICLYLNLSPSGFDRREMLELFSEYEIEPSEIVFEITEQDLLRNPDRIQALLERDFRVAIDDFGTGYSSFEYLKRFDVDCLKVDMSFVQGAAEDETDRAILETVCGLGTTLGLRVIGEGVETEAQRSNLVDYDCGCAQGYLFGHPAAGAAVEKRLFGEPLAARRGEPAGEQ